MCPKNILHGPKVFRDLWFEKMREHILWCSLRSQINIACLEEDREFIVGYSVFGPELEFAYVRKNFRNQGIEELILDIKGEAYGRRESKEIN